MKIPLIIPLVIKATLPNLYTFRHRHLNTWQHNRLYLFIYYFMFRKLILPAFLIVLIQLFYSCSGPRNIYSASPFISPVPMKKNSIAVEGGYFTHSRQTNVSATAPGNHDNGVALSVSEMLKEHMLLFVFTDLKNERNQFHDSIALADDPGSNAYNAGFDSSVLSAKRFTWGAGMELFAHNQGKITTSLGLSLAFHRLKQQESGLLHQALYQRFYNLDQLSFSAQGNLLFNLSDRFKLALVSRVTLVNSLRANTDYSKEEEDNAGLRDGRMNIYLAIPGIYLDYRLCQKIPIFINGQFFNDLAFWNHASAKYEKGRTYLKGTGVSAGLKYIF